MGKLYLIRHAQSANNVVWDGSDFHPDRHPDPDTWQALAERIAGVIGGKTLAEWTTLFEDCDACVAPVLEPSLAGAHPHMRARGIWAEFDGQLQARAAPRFDGKAPADPGVPPRRGEHTAEILASIRST